MATRRTSPRKAGAKETERETKARTGPRGAKGEAKRADAKKTSARAGERRGREQSEMGARESRGNGQRAARPSVGGNGQRKRAGGGARSRANGRQRSERQIEEMFGFVPSYYDAMPDAAIQHAWGLQRDLQLSETSIDPITKELIGLAMASHIKCRYCIYFHTEAALHHGATREQLQEAIAMGGLTVLWSNALTGAQLDLEHFRREVDRALEHLGEMQQPERGRMQHASA